MDGTHLWNLDGTYNIWMEPEHTQNGWNLFMFPNPTPDTLNWSVMAHLLFFKLKTLSSTLSFVYCLKIIKWSS